MAHAAEVIQVEGPDRPAQRLEAESMGVDRRVSRELAHVESAVALAVNKTLP
jgi:hypothetical protein